MTDHGPYDTRRQAHAAAIAAVPPDPGHAVLNHAQTTQLLRQALDDAGVTTGAFDEQILSWLANYEDSTVAVIAGWITRDNRLTAAVRLLEEALHLCMHGERAPGGNENWRDWGRKTEEYLRSLLPQPGEDEGHG